MKENLLSSPLGRLRVIGIIEGISFLLLLGVAMPLKYMANKPEYVKYTGWVHGILFMLYLVALLHVIIVHRWSLKKIALGVLASVFPFGPFLMEPGLKREMEEDRRRLPAVAGKTG
jgi:integral membrane protein